MARRKSYTDQGRQFTDGDFVKLIRQEHAIALSMDGKGCWRDNVFIERFWRSLKYEEVYLHACESASQARVSIGKYIEFYNSARPHSALDGRTPDAAYFTSPPLELAAYLRRYHLRTGYLQLKKPGPPLSFARTTRLFR